MSQALGCIAMTAVAMPTTSVSIGGLADAFGRLCDQALSIGVYVQLELIPMTVVRDIATAWQIIQAADRANSGLVFDTWHFYREIPTSLRCDRYQVIVSPPFRAATPTPPSVATCERTPTPEAAGRRRPRPEDRGRLLLNDIVTANSVAQPGRPASYL